MLPGKAPGPTRVGVSVPAASWDGHDMRERVAMASVTRNCPGVHAPGQFTGPRMGIVSADRRPTLTGRQRSAQRLPLSPPCTLAVVVTPDVAPVVGSAPGSPACGAFSPRRARS